MEVLTASVGFCLGITRAYREMNKRTLAEAPFAVAHANAGGEFDTLTRIERREPALLADYPGLRELSVVRDVSTLGPGLSFTGNARIDGSLTIAGEVQGNIELQGGGSGHVTITQSGTVVGDIRARNISVLGQTVGTLDASGGRVSLHDTASVSGRIRYTHLQVNGADLNAQLERVRSNDPASWRAPEPIRTALAKLQAT